ncbi:MULTISPECIES: hypothetical protein [Flavobacterium]|uniref:Uncharacterized protein n=1 Tax=Flavobacterium hankyongi TaxID=1176532 RepID=A0ABP8ZYU1_9FLAO|nr:hypothetical protein [Flavobacterium sp. N1846]
MKNVIYTLLLVFSCFVQAQVTKTATKKLPNAREISRNTAINNTPNTLIASEIEVYISVAKGIYTTNELYSLFQGNNPKIKLYCMSYGVPSKVEVKAINGIFPNLVDQYETIRYVVKIMAPEKPTYIVACIEEQELAQKNLQLQMHHKDESCSGILSKNNIFGIESNYAGVYKKMDAKEKNCNYIRFIDTDKTIQFRLSLIPSER